MKQLSQREIRPLTDREFGRFQRLIHGQSGIFLSGVKKALVTGRLTGRLRTLGLGDFTSYLEIVEADAEERGRMLDCICTNETRFFREPRQFDFLDEQILPHWRAIATTGGMAKRIRAWSAACSTGEEPYSLAMLLRTHFAPADGWRLDILASDLSTKAIAAAREGTWPIERAEDIPLHYRSAYMLRGVRTAKGKMRVHPELQALIQFRQINLNDPSYAVEAGFDLIFCRNVLIYFNRDTKAAVVDRLSRHLAPGGLLFLGHAETITAAAHGLQQAGPTAYRRKG